MTRIKSITKPERSIQNFTILIGFNERKKSEILWMKNSICNEINVKYIYIDIYNKQ